jgi:hypothetical protein
MGVNDTSSRIVSGIDSAMEGEGLAGALTALLDAICAHFGKIVRLQKTKAGIGGRNQISVSEAYADVAGSCMNVPALEQ